MTKQKQRRSRARRRRKSAPRYEFHGEKRKQAAGRGRRARAGAASRVQWRRWRRAAVRNLAGAAAVLTVGIALVAVVGVALLAMSLPDTSPLYANSRQAAITVLSSDGSKIGTRGLTQNDHIPLSELPANLQLAVLAVEDRRFYNHSGVDLLGLARAAWANYQQGKVVQGGSTISQQLAKNLFLTSERTLKRKAQEALLAFWLEQKFTKGDILELYLNRVYFGAGTYGVEAAARRYFDKSARDVTLRESAMLAGLLKAPSRYAPTASEDRAITRTDLVLASMLDAGFITKVEREQALTADFRFVDAEAKYDADYALDYIISVLPDFIGTPSENIVVRTSLDMRLQQIAEDALDKTLALDGAEANVSQGALVALGPDGAILAMVGGRHYADSSFNRAVVARRQPGSAFKPFVYAAALEAGWREWDLMEDEPLRLGDWSPANYSNRYFGTVTLSTALARSLNTVAIRLGEMVGRGAVIEVARRLGIRSQMEPIRSLALGTQEVTALELTAAYVPFANGGTAVMPSLIQEIATEDGAPLYRREAAEGPRVLSRTTVGAMNRMMTSVVNRGTGRRARLGDRPVAGKTGTTQDYRDAWFVGYSADITAGVWLGNDDFSPMDTVTGGTLPVEAWRTFMAAAHKGLPTRPLPHVNEGVPFSYDYLTSGTVGAPGAVIVEPLGVPGVVVIPTGETDSSSTEGADEDRNLGAIVVDRLRELIEQRSGSELSER